MDIFLKVIEIIGILAFAWSGIIEARKKNMDFIGMYAVAMVTALAGGTLRDVLIDRYPLFWIEHAEYPLLILFFCLAAAFFQPHFFEQPGLQRVVVLLDALGIGLFSATGCYLAYLAGTGIFIAILMGVVTSVFGGVVRDIICNEVPTVFQRSELYATCSFVGSALLMGLVLLGVDLRLATLGCMVVVMLLRILALKYRLTLPI